MKAVIEPAPGATPSTALADEILVTEKDKVGERVGSSGRSSRSRISCSPSPRQTKSTSGHCRFTSSAFKVAKTPPNLMRSISRSISLRQRGHR